MSIWVNPLQSAFVKKQVKRGGGGSLMRKLVHVLACKSAPLLYNRP